MSSDPKEAPMEEQFPDPATHDEDPRWAGQAQTQTQSAPVLSPPPATSTTPAADTSTTPAADTTTTPAATTGTTGT
jgi:hypothetical protein